jgi:hypothetical protein
MAGQKARSAVFAPEVPAIHVLKQPKTWMRGSSPRMTRSVLHGLSPVMAGLLRARILRIGHFMMPPGMGDRFRARATAPDF